MTLFLIPARGGSKGLPGKNLALVAGIPLVGRTARVARRAASSLGGSSRTVCSTDLPAIAEVAREWGAEVPFERPAALASDAANTADVVLHTVDVLGEAYEVVVVLQPTSPLVDPSDVVEAVRLHRSTGDPVVSVCLAEHPAEWMFELDDESRLTRPTAGPFPHQRQGARQTVRPNGAIYVSDVASFRATQSFYRPGTRGSLMPSERSLEIDQPLELDLARAVAAGRRPSPVSIAGRPVGPGEPCFVIAEAGVNHNGDLQKALDLVDAAAAAGADAVKFQTFRADRLVTPAAEMADYQVRNTGTRGPQREMLEQLELSRDAHAALMDRCRDQRVLFLSSPFDESSCDYLDSLDVAALKLPSGELTNLGFLRHAARTKRPLIVSTGMARMHEVAEAMDTLAADASSNLVLLHCVSTYPTVPADVNLRAMVTLREAFAVPVGFSDHTLGDAAAVASIALGASVLEKHLTLDRHLPGPDHAASMEPAAFGEMVARIRDVEAALGHGRKDPAASEAAVALAARKSLVAACEIPAGGLITRDMLVALRPGGGLSPALLESLIGRTARRAISHGTMLTREMLT